MHLGKFPFGYTGLKSLRDDFKLKHIATKVNYDFTEIQWETVLSMALNSQTFSSYKGWTTLKSLIGVAPHGAMTFLSSLYTGDTSDVVITIVS